MNYDFKPTICELPIGSGTVKGLDYKELQIQQYLGIPFATVPGRFRKSKLNESWNNPSFDATQLGSIIPQIKREFYPIPVFHRPWLNVPKFNEYGLNLNISVPKSNQLRGRKKMPVMVFIHGGANTYAAGSTCIYDGFKLSQISLEINEPTIIVTFNYRLGAFGFLASKDLQQYNKSLGEDGVGNYGISDQHNALLWVQKYIEYFGGDKLKVTLFGQSAGSQATHLALLKNEGELFNRVIMQSGLVQLCSVFTVEQYDVVYFKLLDKLGIDKSLPSLERVEKLLEIDEQVLSQANEDLTEIDCVTMAYTEDNSILTNIPKHSEFGKKLSLTKVEAIMIGDCVNECIIWNSAYKDLTAKKFIDLIYSKTTTKEIGDIFLNLYKITENLSQSETFYKIESMTTDALFLLPNYLFYNANNDCMVYHFNQKSTYDNEWKGFAHHSLDNVYIWGLLKETLNKQHQKLSEEMSRLWINFANGNKVWESYGENHKAMVFGDNGKLGQLLSEGEDNERTEKYEIWRKIINLNLVDEFAKMAEDICMLRSTDHGYI